jgi:hypothetical protein
LPVDEFVELSMMFCDVDRPAGRPEFGLVLLYLFDAPPTLK